MKPLSYLGLFCGLFHLLLVDAGLSSGVEYDDDRTNGIGHPSANAPQSRLVFRDAKPTKAPQSSYSSPYSSPYQRSLFQAQPLPYEPSTAYQAPSPYRPFTLNSPQPRQPSILQYVDNQQALHLRRPSGSSKPVHFSLLDDFLSGNPGNTRSRSNRQPSNTNTYNNFYNSPQFPPISKLPISYTPQGYTGYSNPYSNPYQPINNHGYQQGYRTPYSYSLGRQSNNQGTTNNNHHHNNNHNNNNQAPRSNQFESVYHHPGPQATYDPKKNAFDFPLLSEFVAHGGGQPYQPVTYNTHNPVNTNGYSYSLGTRQSNRIDGSEPSDAIVALNLATSKPRMTTAVQDVHDKQLAKSFAGIIPSANGPTRDISRNRNYRKLRQPTTVGPPPPPAPIPRPTSSRDEPYRRPAPPTPSTPTLPRTPALAPPLAPEVGDYFRRPVNDISETERRPRTPPPVRSPRPLVGLRREVRVYRGPVAQPQPIENVRDRGERRVVRIRTRRPYRNSGNNERSSSDQGAPNDRRRSNGQRARDRNYRDFTPSPSVVPEQRRRVSEPEKNALSAADTKNLPADGDGDGIPGIAGKDYPDFNYIPKTSFSCLKISISGYFPDPDTGCQVVHLCDHLGGGAAAGDSYTCPKGKIFNREKSSCDWWYATQCY